MTRRRYCLAITVLALVAGCEKRISAMKIEGTPSRRVATRLADVRRAELFAIDPDDRAPASRPSGGAEADRFGIYRIVARGTVEERSAAQELAKMVGAAVLEPPEGVAKGCIFYPHHGIRFFDADGTPVEVTLCFTCGDALVSGFAKRFWAAREARARFDAFFARHGVTVIDDDR